MPKLSAFTESNQGYYFSSHPISNKQEVSSKTMIAAILAYPRVLLWHEKEAQLTFVRLIMRSFNHEVSV